MNWVWSISGFFVYFEDLSVTPSKDCDEDYIQFGRDILFITSFRSAKFCDKIQVGFNLLAVEGWNYSIWKI